MCLSLSQLLLECVCVGVGRQGVGVSVGRQGVSVSVGRQLVCERGLWLC